MKKLNRWLKSLSLIQQSIILVLGYVIVFSFLIFGYLNSNIDRYIQNQIFSLVSSSQAEVVYAFENGIADDSLSKRVPSNMAHIIIKARGEYFYFGDKTFDEKVLRGAFEKMPTVINQAYQFSAKFSNKEYYYILKRVGEEFKVISLADDGFNNLLQSSLLNGVANILILVLGILFLILLFWVGSIIYPINLIKSYIDKMRKGNEGELIINRDDEIGMLAKSVVAMNTELKRQEKVKVEMLHNISHDFKTPIATIKSYAESIKDGIYPYDSLEKSVDVIYDNAERLDKKVQRLLLLNRFGYMLDESSEVNPVAMQEVIGKVLLANKVIRPELRMVVAIDDVKFTGNQESWRVVVENILDNALRYAKTKIEIILNNEIGLLISNDGEPLDEKETQDIFKPYEKGKEGQFGLGLSIVKRVCNVYGYEVLAYNQQDMVVFRISPKIKAIVTKEKKKKTNESPRK